MTQILTVSDYLCLPCADAVGYAIPYHPLLLGPVKCVRCGDKCMGLSLRPSEVLSLQNKHVEARP